MNDGRAVIDHPDSGRHDGRMINTTETRPLTSSPTVDQAQTKRITKILARRSFCMLATTSPAGHSHAAGVVFDWADGALYIHTMRASRKARNIAANPHIGIVVPARRLPVGPPFTVQFQATATILSMTDATIRALLAKRKLATTSGHGALNEPDGCFLQIIPASVIHTYGIGVHIIDLIKDPLHAGARTTRWNRTANHHWTDISVGADAPSTDS
jgi:Pyridoxamine 5'-phosphate oxidase